MRRITSYFLFPLLFWAVLLPPLTLHAQEEDLHYQVVDIKGKVFIYRDESDETSRLHKGQKVDDGDKVTTDDKSELVLRLKGRAYLRLSARTKIVISKLRWNDSKGVQSRVNLISGRLLTQLDHVQKPSYEVSAAKMIFREFGTLFEVYRKKEEIQLTAYDGVMVANFPGRTQLVKAHQVMKIENGRFRYKHYLKMEEENRLEEWKSRLAEIREKHTQGSR